jgi:hypothetical protein
MKKLYATLAVLCLSFYGYSQCALQVGCNGASCYGACDGTAIAYPVNTIGPVSFLWSPGGQTTQIATGLCAGTYTCVIMDSIGCISTASCTVAQPQPLQAIITAYQNPSCQSCCDGYAIGSATGGTSPYTYIWIPINQTSPTAQSLCTGTYTLCVSDINGCASCDTVSLSFPNSVATAVSETQVNVWGTDNVFTVSAQFAVASSGEIVVTNALGQIVSREVFGETFSLQNTVNLKEEATGLYNISVVTSSGVTTRRVSR